jgi:competence protein ComGF
MKKTFNLILTAAFIFFLMSCSSAIESDAKKAAELACKAQQMAMEGDMTKMQEMQQEAQDLYQEMAQKYQSTEEMQKFSEAYTREMKKCK